MIYDRTMQDVEKAQELFDTKVKSFIALTDDELITMERGRVTVNTLNRIETAQNNIGQMLVELGYLKEEPVTKTWSDGVFFEDDLIRIVNNTKMLRNSFFVISENKEPLPLFDYINFNIVEKILYEIDILTTAVKSTYKRAGAYIAGQVVHLPLKGVS